MVTFNRHRRVSPLLSGGFSLIELSVAILIMALIIGSILVPLTTQVGERRVAETRKLLAEVESALLGFAAAHGRFPCPAIATSNGTEAFDTGGSASDGNCSNFLNGLLPARTLGLDTVDNQGFAVDAWGLTQNRIRYAVSNATVNSISNPFTRTDGMRSAGMANIGAASTLLYVCNSGTGVTASNCGTAGTLAANAIAAIWSVGANAATGGTSTDEAENPNPYGAGVNSRIFVSKARSDTVGSVFDDEVTWIAPYTVFNRMIAAGKLP